MSKNLRRSYDDAKRDARGNLGGETAYWIVGPRIRRMAVGDAILTRLNLQDESIKAETIRTVMEEMYDLLTGDPDFQ